MESSTTPSLQTIRLVSSLDCAARMTQTSRIGSPPIFAGLTPARSVIKRVVQKLLSGSLLIIASQSSQIFGQATNSAAPQWRTRSDAPAPEYERIAEHRSGVTLGRPTEFSPQAVMTQRPDGLNAREQGSIPERRSDYGVSSIDSSKRVTGYREVPHSPWERVAPSASPAGVDSNMANSSQNRSRTSNMIRQPVASAGRSSSTDIPKENSRKSPSRGLPDRNELPTPSEEQRNGSEMTMDLSGYQKPSARGFISQPRVSQSNQDRTSAQRLPYAGVAISTSDISKSFDENATGLGYPEAIPEDESIDAGIHLQPSQKNNPPSLEHPTNSVPAQQTSSSGLREAVRDLPVTTGALEKASQMNERSQEREASRLRYSQQSSLNENASGPGVVNRLPPTYSHLQTVFESESSSRTNVIGVISGGEMPNRIVPDSSDDLDYPYSTDATDVTNVVPASVGMNRGSRGYSSSNPTSTSQVTQMRTAARVSAQLLDGSQSPLSQSPLPIEPPTGWNTIRDSLKANLANCDDLLRRGAILSAREEILIGMRTLFRTIDLRGGTWTSEPAMEQALAAFEEEADFYRSGSTSGTAQTTDRIVSGHRTQALKQTQLHLVSPDLAAQHYRSYSKQQWLQAAQGHPYAADLLYAYGKTLEREADQIAADSLMRRGQAIVCYQSAMELDPRNSDNSNRLGYALLQLDRVDEAQIALNHSIQLNPTPAAWNNLVEVYRRKGESEQVAFAQRKAHEMKPVVQPEMIGVPEVVELDAKTFASISPYPARMQTPATTELPAPPSPVQYASATVPAAAPATKSSWFGKLFR